MGRSSQFMGPTVEVTGAKRFLMAMNLPFHPLLPHLASKWLYLPPSFALVSRFIMNVLRPDFFGTYLCGVTVLRRHSVLTILAFFLCGAHLHGAPSNSIARVWNERA